MTWRVLVIDDDPAIRFALQDYLTLHELEVTCAEDCAQALDLAKRGSYDLALIDHHLPDGDSLSLLRGLRAQHADLAVVILTAVADVELAVRALKEGADHFLTKPIDLATLHVVLRRTAQDRRNARVAAALAPRAPSRRPFEGTSEVSRALEHSATRAAASSSPILILGETGAGKGVLARWIHETGPRADEAMVELNCAGLSRELVESELFGHERGAFTGAQARKQGLLEVAHRGTLFLDEIAELELPVQAKLLKAIEEQRFRRLGAVVDQQVDVRLIAATGAGIRAMVEDGRFRRDLYFRLATVILTVPPLRERRDEIPVIAARLLSELSPVRGRKVLAPEAIAALQAFPWSGNVRELRNVLERAALFCDGEVIDGGAIEQQLRADGSPAATAEGPPRMTLAEVERAHIERVLEACDGRVEQAAEWLGLPRSTLYVRLRRYRIGVGEP